MERPLKDRRPLGPLKQLSGDDSDRRISINMEFSGQPRRSEGPQPELEHGLEEELRNEFSYADRAGMSLQVDHVFIGPPAIDVITPSDGHSGEGYEIEVELVSSVTNTEIINHVEDFILRGGDVSRKRHEQTKVICV